MQCELMDSAPYEPTEGILIPGVAPRLDDGWSEHALTTFQRHVAPHEQVKVEDVLLF